MLPFITDTTMSLKVICFEPNSAGNTALHFAAAGGSWANRRNGIYGCLALLLTSSDALVTSSFLLIDTNRVTHRVPSDRKELRQQDGTFWTLIVCKFLYVFFKQHIFTDSYLFKACHSIK